MAGISALSIAMLFFAATPSLADEGSGAYPGDVAETPSSTERVTPIDWDRGASAFAGWFQPGALVVIVGIPALLLLIYRRGDIARFIRGRSWKSSSR